MSLIEIFTDHILNKKSLKDYVQIRKSLNERGEFNDGELIQAEENLQRLKRNDPIIYKKMYELLAEIFTCDVGHKVEYPINFIREVLRMYEPHTPPKKVYEEYKQVLEHRFCDA